MHLDIGAMEMEQLIDDGLHEFLDDFQQRLIEIDRAITDDILRAEPNVGPNAGQSQRQSQSQTKVEQG